MRRINELEPHPSLVTHDLLPKTEHLVEAQKKISLLSSDPLMVTRDGLIIDGHARWLNARHSNVDELPCIVCDLSPEEALEKILQIHDRKPWLNDFNRVRIALDLEPWFRKQARANQSNGGKGKASSKLTEDKRLDVRRQVAAAAGVCVGNVTKVKQIYSRTPSRELVQSLANGEIRIDPAWKMSTLSISEQKYALRNHVHKARPKRRGRRALATLPPRPDPPTVAILKGLKFLEWLLEQPEMSDQVAYLRALITKVRSTLLNRSSESNA